MSSLSERRNKIRDRVSGGSDSSSAFIPSVNRETATSYGVTNVQEEPVNTGSSLSARRERLKTEMSGRTVKPKATPMETMERNNTNYESRLEFEGAEHKDKKTFWNTLKNGALKILETIDKPRNALWVGIKEVSDSNKGEHGGNALKAFGTGLKEGFTGEQKYTGSDLADDVFGGIDENKTVEKKALDGGLRFLFALGTEMVADPLNLVTLGAGKALKGALTGVGSTLSDEAIEGIAKAATSTLTPDNIMRTTKVAFDNPDALVTAGRISKEAADNLKMVRQLAPTIKDYDDLLTVFKKGDKDAIEQLTMNTFENADEIKTAFLNAEQTLTDFTRSEIRGKLTEGASKYGLSADDMTHFTDRIKIKDVYNIDEDVTQPLIDYISNRTLKGAEKEILTNPKLGGKGLSIGGKSLITGAELQNKGARVSKAVREFGLNNDGARAVLARGYSGFQDSVGTVFSKYFTKGVDAETNKVFKALINAGDSRKGLADSDIVDKALSYRKTLSDAIDEKFPNLSPDKKLEKLEAYESGVSDFIELGKNSDTIARLMLNEHPDMIDAIDTVAKGIKKDLADMGISEAQMGKMNSIMDGYLPHVRNTNLSKLSRKEIRELNLARTGEEDDFIDSINRQTGNSGHVVGKEFSSINKAAKMRHYAGTVEQANLMKRLNTSTQNSAAQFLGKLQLHKSTVYKDLVKANLLKVSDGVPRFNSLSSEPELLRSLLDQIPSEMWSELDGVDNFFETSAVKAYLVRAIQHNKLVGDYSTARDVLHAVGTRINKYDMRLVKDMQAKGYDIVITRGYFENINVQQLQELATASAEKADFFQNIIRQTTESKDTMRSLTNNEIEQLMDLMDTTKMPLEIFAVPSAIRKTYNDIATKQIDAGFKTIGKTLDSLHRMWKPLVTGYRPDFHARNYISSTMNDFLDNGMKSFNPKYKLEAAKIHKGSESTVEIAGETFTGDQLYRIMKEQGALSNMTRDLSQDTLDEALRLKMKSSRSSLGEKAAAAYEKGGHFVGNKIEDNLRATNFVINMERALENGLDIPRAAKYATEKINQFHFDYSDLSEVERKLLRRVMPFYTWARKNIPLQLEQFLDNPAAYGKIGDIVSVSAEENGVDLNNMANWAQGTLPITTPFRNEEGNPYMVSGLFPQADLGTVLQSPKDFVTEQLAGMTPLLKAPIELSLNKSMLTGAPIYRTEAEKNNKILKYVLGQTGAFKDAANTLTRQEPSSGEFSGINTPFGVGRSMIKTYNAEDATYNRGMEYNRYLADVVQGYSDAGKPIATIADIKDIEDKLTELYGSTVTGGSLSERRRRLMGD